MRVCETLSFAIAKLDQVFLLAPMIMLVAGCNKLVSMLWKTPFLINFVQAFLRPLLPLLRQLGHQSPKTPKTGNCCFCTLTVLFLTSRCLQSRAWTSSLLVMFSV
jgi:hypothetical protein